jgi:hypothetical protein
MSMWDARYGEEGFAYGTEPNGFLAASVAALRSPVLCVASGEGRNAVWFAEQGLEVHCVDGSHVGVRKTLELAAERGVTVHAEVGDLAAHDLGTDRWGGVVSIFAHVPPPVRMRLHRGIAAALAHGGALVLEAYTPDQIGLGTGGPPVVPMLYTAQILREELRGLTFEHLEETRREVVEGRYHTGTAAVVQAIARKG